jgi:signal transduction histidine kinase
VLANVMQNAQLGILVFDVASRRILFQNLEAANLLGGVDVEDGYESLSHLFLDTRPAVSSPGGAPSAETLRLGKHVFGYSIYGYGQYQWVVFRDITEKARLESIAEAVETMNNIGYVFSAVRHELGNPINSVKTALSVLQQNWGRFTTETIADYLDRSLGALARAERLLASLKSFSMYEDVQPAPLPLNEYLHGFVRLAAKDLAERGIRINFVPDPAVGLVHADPRALTQVLLNLLANATDALAGRFDPQLTLWSLPGIGVSAVSVMDNGCGMSEEAQRNLFRPFYTSKPAGTGLGLIIAKKMLAKMEGTLEVQSQEGDGTAVTLTFRKYEAAS